MTPMSVSRTAGEIIDGAATVLANGKTSATSSQHGGPDGDNWHCRSASSFRLVATLHVVESRGPRPRVKRFFYCRRSTHQHPLRKERDKASEVRAEVVDKPAGRNADGRRTTAAGPTTLATTMSTTSTATTTATTTIQPTDNGC